MAETRKPGIYMVPVKLEVDGHNGTFCWRVRIEEVDENGNVMHGPTKDFGTETEILNRDHGGEHENFLVNEVKPQLLKHYNAWKQDHTNGKSLEGKSL